MSPSYPLLLLFVLKLENHFSQELEILYRAWAQKNKQITIVFFLGCNPPPPLLPPFPTPKKIFRYGFFVEIHLLESSKLEL